MRLHSSAGTSSFGKREHWAGHAPISADRPRCRRYISAAQRHTGRLTSASRQRVTGRRGQRARGPIGELGREYHWREERGGGQFGDAEAVADQIAGGPKLGLETVERREHLLATPRRAAGVDLHVGLHHHSEGGEEGAVEALRDRPVPQREGGSRELGLRQELVEERAPHVRAELLVEEVLALERPAAVGRVGRVERRLGPQALEALDSARRVVDRRRRARGPAAPSAPSSRGRAGRGSRAGASGARARCPSSRAPSAPSRCSARSGTARGRAVPTLLALGQVVDAAARKPSWRHDSRAQRAVGRASAIGGQGTANSSRVSLQYARVRPSGVLQSESLSMSVRNCACSDPTTLPSRSYKTIGAVPTTPIVPSTYAMGGNPVAVAWSGIPTKQDVPGSATPRKVSTPVHPSPPPSSPVAVNSIGSVDGKSVTPGLNVITPVGASGVPPHVHTRVPRSGAARLAVACTSASATTAIAMLWSPARMRYPPFRGPRLRAGGPDLEALETV